MYGQRIDLVESSGPGSTSYGHMSGRGRGCCGLMNPAGFGHRPWVIRSPEEEYHTDCIDEIFNQGRQSRMVWGGFCEGIKPKLVCIPGKAMLDSATYVATVIEPHLVPLCCGEYGWAAVEEDGALQGAFQKIARVEWNGCAPVACTITRP